MITPDDLDCATQGWYWACGVHDVHGKGYDEHEIETLSEAHRALRLEQGDDECELDLFSVNLGLSVVADVTLQALEDDE